MAYLDVAPMMTALRAAPEEFEMRQGWLHHKPSLHNFMFLRDGRVRLTAHCNCVLLKVGEDQGRELRGCYLDWKNSYWRAIEINREFASHFRPRSPLLKFLTEATGHLHAWLQRRGAPVAQGSPADLECAP